MPEERDVGTVPNYAGRGYSRAPWGGAGAGRPVRPVAVAVAVGGGGGTGSGTGTPAIPYRSLHVRACAVS